MLINSYPAYHCFPHTEEFHQNFMPAYITKWLAVTLLLLVFYKPILAGDEIRHRREVITSKNGAVASDDGRCSVIGTDVLKEGGNAIDAAVAASFCLGVVSAASSGIGGGAFMLIRMANGEAHAIDMRETAPLHASQNMYNGNAILKGSGILSVAVPGEIAGLHKAWKQHGKLPWKRLVMPAAKIAKAGFEISKYLYMQMNRTKSEILKDKGMQDIYASNGTLLNPGDICRNKELACTLREIAVHGPKVFYNGSVGIKLVKDIQKLGGILTLNDLKNYRVKVNKPISANVMGYEILGMPPPSSGGAGMILILNILAQYGIPSGVSGSLGLHRFIESLKHMMAIRMNLGDPEFVNVSQVLSEMLSPKFAEDLKKRIYDNMTFDPSYYGPKWNLVNDHGTSHLSIVDSERNAVSMTSTVNSYFGAGIVSPSTGIVLNNEMDDFSIPSNSSNNNMPPPAPANFIAPLKRPLSSMSPTVVLKDGKLVASLGASGGGMIIAAATHIFLKLFAEKLDPLASALSPRSYHQLIPNVVQYEDWMTVIGDHFLVAEKERAALEKKGHVLKPLAGGTICQFVIQGADDAKELGLGIANGDLMAISDPRKGGIPDGY
uniref:Glutathione hydrolase n=1 Tax=Allium sativum TaxID=4682 RepID=A0A0B6VLP3_ALLSA|nr:gamma-glutamyl transpeptidase [Allium sativum]